MMFNRDITNDFTSGGRFARPVTVTVAKSLTANETSHRIGIVGRGGGCGGGGSSECRSRSEQNRQIIVSL